MLAPSSSNPSDLNIYHFITGLLVLMGGATLGMLGVVYLFFTH